MHYFLDIEGERVDLRGSTFELGRGSPSISPLRRREVSRRHVLLWQVTGQGWWVKNLSDKSSLTINGEAVDAEGRSLNSGDVIRLGGVVDCKYYFDVEATFPGEASQASSLSTLTLGITPPPRPKRELLSRIEVVEEHIQGILGRLERNEALDDRTRATLEQVAQELHRSGDRFDKLTRQIQSSMGLGFGAVALSLGTWLTVGIIDDARITRNFLQAVYEEVGSPEGAAKAVLTGGSAYFAWRRRQKEQKEKEDAQKAPVKHARTRMPAQHEQYSSPLNRPRGNVIGIDELDEFETSERYRDRGNYDQQARNSERNGYPLPRA